MASGSSVGRANNSGSKSNFDFASDDILCSYEDYDDHQDPSIGNHSDPVIGTNSSSKDFHKNRVSRSSVLPPTSIYTQRDVSLNQEVMATIENTMKKYTDNLTRFLEGISSRLSQLELYCYNLDKSIGEMRSEITHDNKEADVKLKSLDKHLQEVHRSVQMLRDKQELAETQKELAKLQLAQKESSSRPQQDEKSSRPATESKKSEDGPEMYNQQLSVPASVAASSQTTLQNITQQPPYYLPATQLPNPAAQPQHQSQPLQGPYPAPCPQYLAPQMAAPSPQQGQLSQPPQMQQYLQYQQQWPQSPVQPTQPPSQIRAPQSVYPTYIQNQPLNPPPQVQLTSSMPMQMATPGAPQQGASQADVVQYGYGGPVRPHQNQPPPQPMKGGSYMMYGGSHQPPQTQFSQGYRPPASGGHMIRGPSPPQFVRNHHPHNELIDKLVNMGYRGDHIASVIQRLEETGQPVDCNAVLDRLNGHSSGGSQSQRAW